MKGLPMPIRKWVPVVICGTTFFLTGCMSSSVQEAIEDTKQKNAHFEKGETEEITPEKIELSGDQKEILNSMVPKDPLKALYENELDVREEINLQIPENKNSFENPEEFSQYVSNLLFQFHKGEINPETFTELISPHVHENFLTPGQEEQISSFKAIQDTFKEHLPSPIVTYKLTDLEHQERVREAAFYRKYFLKNGEELYFITVIKQVNNAWKLFDDSLSPPYQTGTTF